MQTNHKPQNRVLRLWPLQGRWGKVVAIRTSTINRNGAHVPISWLENLIVSAKVVRESAQIAPFPYVKVAAGLVVQVLEVIQAARKNREDFEELAQSLVSIIVAIRETLRAYCDGGAPPPEFMTNCQDFVDKLMKMLSDINEAVRQSSSWTRYLNVGEVRDTIARYRRQIDGVRSNFTLTTVIQLTLKVFADQNPRQLGHTWEYSKPLRLIDAMNVTVELPIDLCSDPSDFGDMLSFLFRKRRGRRYVEHRHYDLTIGGRRSIDRNLWSTIVKPGVTITMDIHLLSTIDNVETDGRQCPTCRHLCADATLGDDVTCPSCQTFFRVSHGIIEDTGADAETPSVCAFPAPPTSEPPRLRYGTSSIGQEEDEETDIKFFRRFRVILEESEPTEQNIPPEVLAPALLHRGKKRQSSRRDLREALDLAKKAVQVDEANEDPYTAVEHYSQSVTLIEHVMNRIGVHDAGYPRLKEIIAPYVDRMNALSAVYSIQIKPQAERIQAYPWALE